MPALTCAFCGTAGRDLYVNLTDRQYPTPGTWSVRECPVCGLVWLDPRPLPEAIPNLYPAEYYTHTGDAVPVQGEGMVPTLRHVLNERSRLPARVFGRWPIGLLSFPSLWRAVWLGNAAGARLLDVGCGDGLFLATMRLFGWSVTGVEPDPGAADVARGRGLDVWTGTVETIDLPRESFDVITMHHVIEHLDDPLATLVRCHVLLRPGGRLVIQTPNIDSIGHRALFREKWVHLDPPRHMFLFSVNTLSRLIEQAGLSISAIGSTSRGSDFTWLASSVIREHGRLSPGWRSRCSRRARLGARVYRLGSAAASMWSNGGDNLEAIAVKGSAA